MRTKTGGERLESTQNALGNYITSEKVPGLYGELYLYLILRTLRIRSK